MATTLVEFNEQQQRDADSRHAPVLRAHLEGRTQVEIAQQMNVTRARINAIIKRARKRGLLD